MLSRRKFIGGVSVAALFCCSPALAGINNPGSGSGSSPPSGKALIGGFDTNGNSFAFANAYKTGASNLYPSGTANFNFPAVLDSNGYPNNAASNSLTVNLGYFLTLPPAWGTAPLVGKFSGTGFFYFQFAHGEITSYTVTGGTGVTDTSNLAGNPAFISVAGTNVRVTFNFATAPASSSYQCFFPIGTYNGMSNLVFCRASDEAAIAINPNAFNPDFITLLKALNPKILRAMDWSGVNNGNCASRFSYRSPAGAFGFLQERFPPECVVATAATGTDTYACSTPSGWAGLVDGATVIVQFTNANTLTGASVTLNVGSTGAIQITDLGPNGISGAGQIPANSIWTLTYSSVYNYWTGHTNTVGSGTISHIGGLNTKVPIEQHVALANTINAHLWYNLSHRYSTTDAASVATTVKSSLISNLNFYVELSNEVWNPSFLQTSFIENYGTVFGFSASNNRQLHGGYGVLVRMMMGAITTAWGGANSRLKRVMAFQAFDGGIGTGGSVNVYRLQGTDLALVASGGAGNAAYGTYTGNANYTASPNRPIDYCDLLSYATYYSGAQCANFDANYSNTGGGLSSGGPASGPGSTISGLTGAADAFAAGGGTNIANAIAWLDWDINQGTNNGVAGGQTLLALNSGANSGTGIYPAWETVAASYDASRPSIGLTILSVECYEGAMECVAPSTAECTTLGISTTYSAKINNLLISYKGSATFQATVTAQFNQFLAQTHSKTPAWFALQGPSQWSMLTGDTYSGPSSLGGLFSGTPYTSWNANVAFN